jgi:hypothetical protein
MFTHCPRTFSLGVLSFSLLALAVACASSNKMAPVVPGTFPQDLPPIPPGLTKEAYCVSSTTSSQCENSDGGSATCQDTLREMASDRIYELEEEQVQREKQKITKIVNNKDDRSYADTIDAKMPFRAMARRLESNVFKTNGGSSRAMRVCVSDEDLRLSILMRMKEMAVADGRTAVASAAEAEMKLRYPDGVVDAKTIRKQEEKILEHFNDLYKESLKDSQRSR